MNKLIPSLLIFALLIVSCSPANKTESATETAATDSSASEIIESPEPTTTDTPVIVEDQPFNGSTENFPSFSLQLLSEDSLEVQLNTKIGNVMEAYDTIEFSRITASYSWERPRYAQAQDGPGFMSTETEEETRVWYFDGSNQLRGFSSEFNSDSGYPYTKIILYLLSNDSIITAYQRMEDNGEVTVVQETKLFRPLGERCGMSITYGASESPGIDYQTLENLESMSIESAQALDELITFLKASRKKARTEEDDLIFIMKRTKEGNAEDKSKTITFDVEIRMGRELYDGYVAVR